MGLSSPSDEWISPPEILDALGSFDLDPCAHLRSETAIERFFDDGLAADWWGRIWLNPPYSNVAPWLRRMAGHNRGTAFLYAKTDIRAWHNFVWPVATAMFFFRGRVRFLKPDGTAPNSGKSPSVLIAYGVDDADRLEAARFDGAFVPLLTGLAKAAGLDLSWHDLIVATVRREGGKTSLRILYERLSRHPKARGKDHYRAKIRQQVQRATFERVGPGEYRLT